MEWVNLIHWQKEVGKFQIFLLLSSSFLLSNFVTYTILFTFGIRLSRQSRSVLQHDGDEQQHNGANLRYGDTWNSINWRKMFTWFTVVLFFFSAVIEIQKQSRRLRDERIWALSWYGALLLLQRRGCCYTYQMDAALNFQAPNWWSSVVSCVASSLTLWQISFVRLPDCANRKK